MAIVCCPHPRRIGALIPGGDQNWGQNSRVGPFMLTPEREDCELSNTWAGIFRSIADPNVLQAWVSVDQGVNWSVKDIAGFNPRDNDIISFDAHQDDFIDHDIIQVAVQETLTGRVSYSAFSLFTLTWVIDDETVNLPEAAVYSSAYAPVGNTNKIAFTTPVTLGANTTLVGWYYLTNAVNNYNPIWGSDGANEVYYGSGASSGKVGIVKAAATIFQSTNSVSAGGWHLLIIRDNGVAIDAKYDDVDMGNSVGAYTSLAGMVISKTNQGQNSNNFSGRMQGVHIFNRALTDLECTQLYNSGAGLYGDITIAPFNSGLTLGYNLNEGIGFIAHDISSNENHGILPDDLWTTSGLISGSITAHDSFGYTYGAVSITMRNPSGKVVIGYDSNQAVVSGTPRQRYLVRVRESIGNWTKYDLSGDYAGSDVTLGRLVAGLENRIWSMCKLASGAPNPHFQLRGILGDNSLTTVHTWHAPGVLGTSDTFFVGTYHTYMEDSVLKMAIPVRLGGEAGLYVFIDADAMTTFDEDLSTSTPIWAGTTYSQKPSFAVKYTARDTTLHRIDLLLALVSPTWIQYDEVNQYGPIMPVATQREFDANIIPIGDTNWIATFLATSSGIKFEFLDESTLTPTDTETFDEWITRVLTQDTTIEEDCVDTSVDEGECPEVAVEVVPDFTQVVTAVNAQQYVDILTPVFHGSIPHRRKDSYSLKFKINTGGDPVEILIYKDTDIDNPVSLGAISSDELTEKVIDISEDAIVPIGVVKSWQIRIRGLVTEFQLSQLSILYDLRPEQLTFIRHLIHDLGPQKKRVRVWPVIMDTLGDDCTITPIVDGVAYPDFVVNSSYPKTHFYQFITDVFGVDYAMKIHSGCMFELFKIETPEIVQVLPIAKRFDQVGSEELFRYGKIKRLDIRLLAFGGTSIPYTIYFQDIDKLEGDLTVEDGLESSYTIPIPKTTAGTILRIELGPTEFDFHRFYISAQIQKAGRDTEEEWVTLGEATQTGRNFGN